MALMDAATRSEVQSVLLASLFSGHPPDPSMVQAQARAEVARRGYALAESGLAPWARKLELETGSLVGQLNRAVGVAGVDSASLDLAMLAASGVLSLRGQGVGPESWLLWLDQSAARTLADAVVSGALAKLPAPAIVTQAGGLLQAFEDVSAMARQTTDFGWAMPLPAEELEAGSLPVRVGTGSFGPVAFEASSSKVKTWSGLSREHKGRYAVHEVLGATPRLEFLAPEISPTTFTVRLDSGLGASPAADLEELAALCRQGRVERLVLGGQNLGPHVLESVKESWRRLGPGGVVLVAEAELTLKEYA